MKEEKEQIKRRLDIKSRIILFLLLIIVIIGSGSYIYFTRVQSVLNESRESNAKIEMLNQEINRCSALISQESGNFEEYQYCRQLLMNF